MLKTKGYEVFEKYNGWNEYRKKVIDKKNKIEDAKNLAQRFWWLPIIISIAALLLFAIFKRN
jgi:CRISPR/Cas system-associated protein Csx1